MANFHALHSVGQSLVTYLANTYPDALRAEQPCDFHLISSGELASPGERGPELTVFLYRVTVNEHLRSTTAASQPSGARPPLSLDLHLLLSVWADNALAEHSILAWTMMQLHRHPVLDASALTPEAGWNAGDFVQLIPAELSTEDLMRIWDALDPPYRLSVSYIARVVRIDGEAEAGPPVVASRFTLTNRGRGRR
jgi:hypothetical protein